MVPRDDNKTFNSLSLGNDDTEFDVEFKKNACKHMEHGLEEDNQKRVSKELKTDSFDPQLNMEVVLPRGVMII